MIIISDFIADFSVNYRAYAPTIMYIVGFILMMVVSLVTSKKHKISKFSAFFFTLVSYYGGVTGAMFMGEQFTKVSVKYGGGESVVAIFGAVMFVPFYIIGAALITGRPWRNIMDTMAPGGFIILTCAKFGCAIFGCCPGIPCEFGVYNNIYKMVMFPSQYFESATMCIVVAFCFWYGLKYKKRVPGKAYPLTIMFYSVIRFAWEFMRYYEIEEMRHMLLGLTFWQLWCIVTFLEGFIWLMILNIPKLPEYEEKYYSFINSFYKKIFETVKSRLPRKTKAAEGSASK